MKRQIILFVLGFLSGFLVQCSRVQLIEQFLQQRSITSLILLHCVQETADQDVVRIVKALRQSFPGTIYLIDVNGPKFHRQLSWHMFCERYKTGIILNLQCSQIQPALERLSENTFFNTSYNWLMFGGQEKQQSIRLLSHQNINYDANIVLALDGPDPREPGYDLFDVGGTVRRRGGKICFTFLGNSAQGILPLGAFQPRPDLSDIELWAVVSTINQHRPLPFIEKMKSVDKPKSYSSYKYTYQLVKLLQMKLKFKLKMILAEDWRFDLIGKNSSIGAVGQIQSKIVDFSMVPYALTTERLNLCDFTIAITRGTFYTIFRHPKSLNDINIFLLPFEAMLWFGLIVVVASIALFLAVSSVVNRQLERTPYNDLIVGQSILGTLGMLCQQGFHTTTPVCSKRIVAILMMFFSALLLQFYATFIVGYQLITPPKTINTLEKLVDSNVKMSVENLSFQHDFFARTTNPIALRLYKQKILPNKYGFVNVTFGIQLVKQGGYAFHCDTSYGYTHVIETFSEQEICELSEVLLYPQRPVHLPMIKGSPLRELFKVNLQLLKEYGLIAYHSDRHFITKPKCIKNSNRVEQIYLTDVRFAFFLLSAGLVASGVMLALEDSDDSDGEGGLGNVSRVIVRPPGHSGKAKRGHLCFDAAFETGNLGRVDLVGEFEYDLFLRPDTCNPRYRFWFNFTVDNVKQDQRVIFNIVNINKSRNLFKDGMTPLVKSTSRPKWQRLPRCEVFYYKSPIHQNHYVLSFAFGFDKEDEVYQFALTFPYSYSKMQAYLNALELKYPEAYERSSLGMSIQNRKLELVTFDDVKKPDKVDPKNVIHMVVILARIHPGESPASYVVQGLIEFLAAASQPIAKALREHVVFKIVPMLNPDGVFLGNNRCNVIGHDLNRSWNKLSQYTHPTLSAVMKMLKEYDNSSCYQVDFVIDIHAHSSLTGTFIYGSTYDNVYRYERHLVFPKLFATKCEDFCQEHMMFNADDRKSGTARRYFVEALSDIVNTYTLEVSMCGYFLNGTNILTQYTEDGYMRIGRNLARTFLEYYRFTNILPIPPVDELRPRKSRPRTHRPRARSKTRSEVRARPKTTRAYAPISYTDLSICYDSATSDDGSPVRYMYHGHPGYAGFRMRPLAHQDQFSLSNIQAARFSNLDFTSDFRLKVSKAKALPEPKIPPIEMLNVPPKPHLTIIDFNQLTRGGLDEATAGRTIEREKEKIRRHTLKSCSSRKA